MTKNKFKKEKKKKTMKYRKKIMFVALCHRFKKDELTSGVMRDGFFESSHDANICVCVYNTTPVTSVGKYSFMLVRLKSGFELLHTDIHITSYRFIHAYESDCRAKMERKETPPSTR